MGTPVIKQGPAAVKLAREGLTQTQIADVLGISQPRVSQLLRQYVDTKALAKARLQHGAHDVAGFALKAADVASQRGDGSVALELLDRLDVAPKKQPAGDKGTKVMVVVGSADPMLLPEALRPKVLHGSTLSESTE